MCLAGVGVRFAGVRLHCIFRSTVGVHVPGTCISIWSHVSRFGRISTVVPGVPGVYRFSTIVGSRSCIVGHRVGDAEASPRSESSVLILHDKLILRLLSFFVRMISFPMNQTIEK